MVNLVWLILQKKMTLFRGVNRRPHQRQNRVGNTTLLTSQKRHLTQTDFYKIYTSYSSRFDKDVYQFSLKSEVI